MITCKACLKREKCIERGDPDAISGETDVTRCLGRVDEQYVKRLAWFATQYAKDLYAKEPMYVYRICPKCNDQHNGTCEHCAWNSVISNCGCTTFGLWGDGQYDAEHCTIVKRRLIWNELPTLARHYLTHVFLSEEAAKGYLMYAKEKEEEKKRNG